jgi:hypothetical protein
MGLVIRNRVSIVTSCAAARLEEENRLSLPCIIIDLSRDLLCGSDGFGILLSGWVWVSNNLGSFRFYCSEIQT